MQAIYLAIVIGILAPTALGQTTSEPISLFDGSISGWEGDQRFWSVEDEAIVGQSSAKVPCEQTTYLTWKGGLVGNFELELDFRIESGNSGVQFRSTETGPWKVEGYQADLDFESQWTGGLYEQGGREVIARRGQQVTLGPSQTDTSLFETPALADLVKPGDWNHYRIRAEAERIELFVNDQPTAIIVDRNPAHAARSGLLALQLHEGPPMTVAFRNIQLRHLGIPPTQAGEPKEAALVPQWIWCRDKPRDHETAEFTTSFECTPEQLGNRPAIQTILRAAADNHLEVRLNGKLLAAHSDWQRPCEVDLSAHLAEGDNQLSLWCKNDTRDAGLWAELETSNANGVIRRKVSDASWNVRTNNSEDWQPASVLGPVGIAPWGIPVASVPGHVSLATDPKAIEVPEGFEVELVYSVPGQRQGSWVCLTFDDLGRAITSDQYGRIYAMDPQQPQARAVPIADGIGSAQGLLHAFGALYTVVNGNNPDSGLYRLRDLNSDGTYEDVQLLQRFEGAGEHGPHAVLESPDGKHLWIVAGNHTALPKPIQDSDAHSRVPRIWAEEQLLPKREDPNGHAVGIRAPGGWIARTDPDGKEWELICCGLRNAYDLDFDRNGEPFTFDSDMEWDVGLPWYRPTRVLHAVSGADFGWRSGSGKWPADSPDSLPGVADIGRSSPTGVVHGRRGAFPAPWSNALFVADWSYGLVHAVHIEPQGALYNGKFETFIKGRALPVTDMAFGPDGALWFTTGGRGAQSGLYRVRWTGPQATEAIASHTKGTTNDMAKLQGELTALHGTPRSEVQTAVWSALGSPDAGVRHAARTALEFVPAEIWRDRALTESDPVGGPAALLALIRCDSSSANACIQRVLQQAWLRSEPTRQTALRIVELACIRNRALPANLNASLASEVSAIFPSGIASHDRELARLGAHLQVGALVPTLLDMASEARTQEVALHYAWCLRTLRNGWHPASRIQYLQWLADAESGFVGGVSLSRYLSAMRDDFFEPLDETTRQQLLAQVQVKTQDPNHTTTQAKVPLPFLREWHIQDLEGQLPLVSSARSFENGQRVFLQADCQRCHRFDNTGGADGPDLATVGGRFGPRDLLLSILEPSRTISDQYQQTEIWTHDGQVLLGRALPRDGEWLRIQQSGTAQTITEVHQADIELLRPRMVSSMPSRLLDPFSTEEVLDLLAYLIAAGNREDPAFD